MLKHKLKTIPNTLVSHNMFNMLDSQCMFIGAGSYNQVYQHPFFTDRVIKYNPDQCDGTLAFAKYCKQNKPNANLPVVFDCAETLWHDYVVQEKLAILTKKHYNLINAINAVISGTINWCSSLTVFANAILEQRGSSYEKNELAFVQTVHNVVLQFASHFNIDINIDNVMLRNNTLVLSDPLADQLN